MNGNTYADGLREAARLCRAEILPTQPTNVVELKRKPNKELDEAMSIIRPMLEATMTMMAARLDRLAAEAELSAAARS